VTEPGEILIAGGGPVGLVTGYALAKEGIPVIVFDDNSELQEDPRAATTHPATLELLGQLGVIDQVIEQGLVSPIFRFWDRPTGEMVAEFDHALLKNDTPYPFVVQCEQFKLTHILLDLMAGLDNCDVKFSHRVSGLSVGADRVSVDVETPGGPEQFTGRYLIGCDGGRSLVRKEMDIDFEGFTWAERFLVLTTPFDFEAERGMCYRNYIADPEEWCNCFKVAGDGPPGLWRTVYPADPDVPEESLMSDEFVQNKLQNFFPLGQDYDIVHRNLYTVHQRVAATFRKGPVLLAGDACHVNNSIGGMGLNGGIQDAMNLAEKLVAVWKGDAGEDLLDRYDAQRRSYAKDYVQQQSIQNKKRLEASGAQARKRSQDELRATAADPEKARAFMLQTSMIEAMRAIED
jgi:3-(3-hydroxy-phenyl)propionate hydroxylase